jgi:hypothetical protein
MRRRRYLVALLQLQLLLLLLLLLMQEYQLLLGHWQGGSVLKHTSARPDDSRH